MVRLQLLAVPNGSKQNI